MILVADSGSTCTKWVILEENKMVADFSTKGFNPYFTKSKEIHDELLDKFPKAFNHKRIEKIFFYGAGCSTDKLKRIISNELHIFFQNSFIYIETDLLAAARSLFHKEAGIAIILGTGSNTCFYNGSEITQNIRSLGFILGDEGGGDYLGKLFIQALLNKELPINIEKLFFKEFNLDTDKILHAVYKEEYPNRFLASFTKFIKANSSTPEIQTIIDKSFIDLFEKHICKYINYKNEIIRATGSIAHYFEKDLKKIAANYELDIDLITKDPINLLTEFHLKYSEF